MKLTKQLVCAALALIMTASLAGCGTSGTMNEEEAQQFIETITQEAQEVASAVSEDITVPSAEPADSTAPSAAPADSTAPAAAPAAIANPITEYDSLQEINDIVGCSLCHPAVMGVAETGFRTINGGDFTVAEYEFEVNGMPYTFRAAKTEKEDISGIYIDGESAFPAEQSIDPESDLSFEYVADDTYHLARWYIDGMQYVLCVMDESIMDGDQFVSIADEMQGLTLGMH